MINLIVNNTIVVPIGDIKVDKFMKRQASTISFKMLKSQGDKIELGNKISLNYDGKNVFVGFIFNINENENDVITVKGYDQLRYLKNSHTMLIKNKTATKVIQDIATEFNLKIGKMVDTVVDIAPKQKIIENKTLIDIIYDCLEDTMIANNQKGARKQEFLLYDKNGQLSLSKLTDLKSNLILTEKNCYGYSYEMDIDNKTYSKIYIYYKDDNEHKINKFIIDDSNLTKKYGVLQKTINTQRITKEQAEQYGKKLLKYYGVPQQRFKLKTLIGDVDIIGGTSIAVRFNSIYKNISNYMVVDKVTHIFSDNDYTMELDLLGVDMA